MLKRGFDIAASSLGLIIFSPVLVILALLVKLDSAGPVLYQASRIGKGGIEFKLLKYRSMVVDADKIGPGITGARDPRITRLGAFLRRTKLDELPQLLNVFKGEMSFVGPRPEAPQYVAHYTPEQREVLSVRPGITGLASIKYRHEEALLDMEDRETYYIERVMPEKIELEMEYIRKPSLLNDIYIIIRTVAALFR